MTRFKIQRMKFCIFLSIFLFGQIVVCSGSFRERSTGDDKPPTNITSKLPVEVSNGTIQTTTLMSKESIEEGHQTSLNSGALLRGFCVFIGLSILVMAYIVFRNFRLSKTRAQMIRKYGILAHRQDVEMRPLPLDEEDDEDTTVFDASNVLTNNAQHLNL
ncbi:PREDICTED: membrane protein FAM174-like [Polistes canadensis]|uniref:membrane protein FAM174-like n=1 Tax=Polistes canadensis TaxID=91411 RepID=UPI000718F945|nr:PREDICTED: membrane protein FAM174-like [Polistes canadensis]XP_014603562.1 PREDICTED: membrane protein FAM174-like [Polistes canadensis]KAI4493618.1 hypothetical protein M0804_001794 [Polistes exclamans]